MRKILSCMGLAFAYLAIRFMEYGAIFPGVSDRQRRDDWRDFKDCLREAWRGELKLR